MDKLIDHFFIQLYKMTFEEDTPCMSQEAMEEVVELADWFSSLDGIYLRVFGSKKSSHFLSRYATEKLVMQEVAYHLSTSLSRVLQRKKKEPQHTLPLQIGSYEIMNLKAIETEVKELGKFKFNLMEYHLYDPRNVCKQHCAKIRFNWPNKKFSRQEEEMFKNYYNASNPHALVNFIGTSQVTPKQEETLEEEPSERHNLVRGRGKWEVVHNLSKERSHKWKEDPNILKEAIVAERRGSIINWRKN